MFNRLDWPKGVRNRPTQRPNARVTRHGSNTTKKKASNEEVGFATIIASGLAAAVLGFAGPAQADIGHHDWIYDIQPQVSVPHVDTSVHQSR